MDSIAVIFILAFDVTLAILFGKLATKKGYPGAAWGIIGFFIPILYLIILLIPYKNLENISKQKNNESSTSSNIPSVVSVVVTVFGIALFLTFIVLVSQSTNKSNDDYNDYEAYVIDCLIPAYINIKTNNWENTFDDQKIYVQDLYKLYQEDYFIKYDDFEWEEDDEFTSYYVDNEYNLKDDYVVVYNEKVVDGRIHWENYYYSKFDEEQELLDYVMSYVVENYENKVTNNYEKDVKSEKIRVSKLYKENYISSPYFRKLYENNEEKVKNDYIEVTSRGGKIYDHNYFEG